jgi:hypothetical protein
MRGCCDGSRGCLALEVHSGQQSAEPALPRTGGRPSCLRRCAAILLLSESLVPAQSLPLTCAASYPHPPAGPWLSEFTDLREVLNLGDKADMSLERLREITYEVYDRIQACGRTYPIPKLSAKCVCAFRVCWDLRAATSAIRQTTRQRRGAARGA